MAVVEVSESGGLTEIALNRPATLNAFDLELAFELRQAIEELHPSAPDAVIITGRDGAFSAGGDVKMMAESGDPAEYLRRLTADMHAALIALRSLPIPVIARVDGAVAGGAIGLALACDLIIATPRTSFTAGYGMIGLSPDCGVSMLLPQAVGGQRARQLLMGGGRIDAATALSWGLITDIVESADLDSAVIAAVAQMRRVTTDAFARTKGLLTDVDTYRAHLGREAGLIVELAGTSARRYIAAFAGRRAGRLESSAPRPDSPTANASPVR